MRGAAPIRRPPSAYLCDVGRLAETSLESFPVVGNPSFLPNRSLMPRSCGICSASCRRQAHVEVFRVFVLDVKKPPCRTAFCVVVGQGSRTSRAAGPLSLIVDFCTDSVLYRLPHQTKNHFQSMLYLQNCHFLTSVACRSSVYILISTRCIISERSK